jgi:hypothetical protein
VIAVQQAKPGRHRLDGGGIGRRQLAPADPGRIAGQVADPGNRRGRGGVGGGFGPVADRPGQGQRAGQIDRQADRPRRLETPGQRHHQRCLGRLYRQRIEVDAKEPVEQGRGRSGPGLRGQPPPQRLQQKNAAAAGGVE